MMTLERQLIKNKSSLIYKGVGAITFGLVALCYPGDNIKALTIPFGCLLMLSGLMILSRNILYKGHKKTTLFSPIGKGLAEFFIGLCTLFSAMLQVDLLWELIAIWVMMSGVFQIITFRRLKPIVEDWKIMVISGSLAVIFGVSILANSSLKLMTPTYELAIFAIFYGICFLYTFFKLKEELVLPRKSRR